MANKKKIVLTAAQLRKMMPNAKKGEIEKYLPHLNSLMAEAGIDTELRAQHFLAQLAHESGSFRYIVENLNYTKASTIKKVYSKYFKKEADAIAYVKNSEGLANRVYANRMGNTEKGDGWKYRGRGLIQLTGKENYKNLSKDTGIDFVNNPDWLSEPKYAVMAATWFWNKNGLNKWADADNIEKITRKINGGVNGLDDRKKYFARAQQMDFSDSSLPDIREEKTKDESLIPFISSGAPAFIKFMNEDYKQQLAMKWKPKNMPLEGDMRFIPSFSESDKTKQTLTNFLNCLGQLPNYKEICDSELRRLNSGQSLSDDFIEKLNNIGPKLEPMKGKQPLLNIPDMKLPDSLLLKKSEPEKKKDVGYRYINTSGYENEWEMVLSGNPKRNDFDSIFNETDNLDETDNLNNNKMESDISFDGAQSAFENFRADCMTLAPQLVVGLDDSLSEVTDLSTALCIEDTKAGLGELQAMIAEGIFTGVGDILGTMDGVVSSFEQLNEVMSSADSSAWEKIMALWSTFTTVVEGFQSVVSVLESIFSITELLTGAEEKKGGVEQDNVTQKIANMGTEMALESTKQGIEGASALKSTANAGKEAAASGIVVSAKTAEAGAAAAAAVAKTWWLAPVIGAAILGVSLLARKAAGGKGGGGGGSVSIPSGGSGSGSGGIAPEPKLKAGSISGEREVTLNVNFDGVLKGSGSDLVAAINSYEQVKAEL